MPKETVDGAVKETTIDLRDEVIKRLEAGAGQPPAKKADEEPETEPEADQGQQEGAEGGQGGDAQDDDVLEYEDASGAKQTLKFSDLKGNAEARKALADQLRRGTEAPKQQGLTEEQVQERERRFAIQQDIDRGLVRLNKYTGRLELTALGKQMSDAAEGGERETPVPDDATPLHFLSEQESTEFKELRTKALAEGDVEAMEKADALRDRAVQRFTDHRVRQTETRVGNFLQQKDEHESANHRNSNNLRLVNAEMAKHPNVFGKYDPQTGTFEHEMRARIARNQVAVSLEKTKSAKVDERHLATIGVVVKEFASAAPAPSGGNQPAAKGRESPPPSTGRGSKVPPGPPPRKEGGGAGANKNGDDKDRRRIGSSAMLEEVTRRLQETK